MRRVLLAISITGLLAVAGCTTSGSTGDTNSVPMTNAGNDNPITGPIDRASSVVNQQNAQLQQEEQRTGYADPTVP